MKQPLFFICLLLLVIPVFAQDKPLTLPDALKYALSASQTAHKAKLDVENVEHQIAEVKAGALPTISGSGSLTYNPLLQLTPIPGELTGQPGTTTLVAFGQKWNSGANVNLSQNLYNKGVITGLRAANSSREFYRINAQLTDEQLIEQVSGIYYQVLVEKHKLNVLDTTIENTARISKVIKGLYESGLAKEIDVDRTTVNLSNLYAQRQQILNSITLQENQLKFAMGMEIQTPLTFPPIEFKKILTQGDTSRPDVNSLTQMQLLRKQGELLEFKKQSIKAEYYPSLSLSGNYGVQGLGNSFPMGKGPSVNWFDYASIGLNLKIPIFNGFSTRSKVRQANIEILKMKEDIDQASLSLNLAYENAATQLKNSLVVLRSQLDNATLAQKVYRNTQSNYNLGLAPLTDLLDAENALTDANNNYSSALLAYRIAEIQLLKTQGKLKSLLNE
ncbi:TolC family protein [Flavihumibacter petaseus]|nr:TolC family protein [Flavihumibacter petaseus]